MDRSLARDVETLVERELQYAVSRFAPFHSAHEGWAVLQEELEELAEELNKAHVLQEELWSTVRTDQRKKQLEIAEKLSEISLRLVKEAVQVAAMAKRFTRDI